MAEKKIKKEKIDNVGIHSFSKKADIFFSIISGLIALSCILPFIFVIIISVTDEKSMLFCHSITLPDIIYLTLFRLFSDVSKDTTVYVKNMSVDSVRSF